MCSSDLLQLRQPRPDTGVPGLALFPLTFPAVWDKIVGQSIHTARTGHKYPPAPPDREDRLRLRADHGQEGEKDGPSSGPGDGRGPLPATEGSKGPPRRAEDGWHHESRALSSHCRDGSALFCGAAHGGAGALSGDLTKGPGERPLHLHTFPQSFPHRCTDYPIEKEFCTMAPIKPRTLSGSMELPAPTA